MKEITSKKTGHIDIVTDDVWYWMVANGMAKRFNVSEVVERKLKEVPTIKPPEVKTKTKNKNG